MVLLQQLMQVATQPSPVKATFSHDDIELAAVALVQHLIASMSTFSRPSQSADEDDVVFEPRRSSNSEATPPSAPVLPSSLSAAAATAAAASTSTTVYTAVPNDAVAKQAAVSPTQRRRHSTSVVRPILPVVSQLMEMGFARRKAKAAVKHLGILLNSFTFVV